MAGLIATIPALVEVVKDYYSYPVTTKVTVKAADNATFPAVTVCGLNRFKTFNEKMNLITNIGHEYSFLESTVLSFFMLFKNISPH